MEPTFVPVVRAPRRTSRRVFPAPEDLPNIYRRFWRADTSRTLPGNGLGLALVQALVRSYGGTIDCASAPGRGTRFSIFLPAPPP